mmetsp:Transcript_42326/g.57774  ORF Transcript_42326/g.57774 Transcript_42326/m.57774 type:complete len:122 (-) Transcript_42326:100-465(-)
MAHLNFGSERTSATAGDGSSTKVRKGTVIMEIRQAERIRMGQQGISSGCAVIAGVMLQTLHTQTGITAPAAVADMGIIGTTHTGRHVAGMVRLGMHRRTLFDSNSDMIGPHRVPDSDDIGL